MAQETPYRRKKDVVRAAGTVYFLIENGVDVFPKA